MKTKQIVGIIIAALAFVFICTCSMFMHYFMDSFLSAFDSVEAEGPTGRYIGVITVEGTIGEEEESIFESTGYNHDLIMDSIDTCEKDSNNKGILLVMDTPGGEVKETDDVYLRLMKYKEKTSRPIWAYIDTEACSGGYYISMAADKILANRNANTGSIGVYIGLTNYKGLYDKLGIDFEYITTGDNKTMGAPSEKLTEEQKKIFQSIVDESFAQFKDIVATGRPNLSKEEINKLADGRIYTANQAKKNGLIDDTVLTFDDAKDLMTEEVGSKYNFYEFTKSDNWLDGLFSKAEKVSSKSEEEIMLEYIKNNKNGEAMYYAMPGQY